MTDGKRFATWDALSTDALNRAMWARMQDIAWHRSQIAQGGYSLSLLHELAREANQAAHDCSLIARELKSRARRGEEICEEARTWQD